MRAFLSIFACQWMAYLLVLATPVPAVAEDTQQQLSELLSMDISELMDVKVVLPTRKAERQFDVPAAVYVITQEDIRRSGLTRIPDLLRMVPGVHVGQLDNNTWAISSRSKMLRLSNSMLVLLDGRTLYNPLFGGVYWDVQDTLIQDIDRIEIIRGPGGSLWGANAVDGIINIITKSSRNTEGTLLYGGAGHGKQRYEAALRHGIVNPDTASGRIYAKQFKTDQGEYLDANESTNNAVLDLNVGDSAHDSGIQSQAGFRSDWTLKNRSTLTVQGDAYDAEYDNIRISNPIENTVDANGHNIIVKWAHQKADSDVDLQFFYDYTERLDNVLKEKRHTYDLDFQHSIKFSRHVFTWGLGYRFTSDDVMKTDNGVFALDPEEYSEKLYSAFFQEQIELEPDQVYLTLGSKFEKNESSGEDFQPTVRLLWKPDDDNSVWASITRAVRTPTRSELHALLIFCDPGIPGCTQQIGNPEAKSESVVASELGYRSRLTSASALDIALFNHRYYETDDTTNVLNTYGYEAVYEHFVSSSWRYEVSVTHHKGTERDKGVESSNGTIPENKIHLRSYYNINEHWEFDTLLYYVTAIDAPATAPGLDDYIRIDLRLGWNPHPSLQTSLSVTNLTDDAHGEALDLQRVNTATGRAFFLSLNYKIN